MPVFKGGPFWSWSFLVLFLHFGPFWTTYVQQTEPPMLNLTSHRIPYVGEQKLNRCITISCWSKKEGSSSIVPSEARLKNPIVMHLFNYNYLLGINKKSFALATHTGKVVVCQAQLLFVWQAHSTGAVKIFPAHQTS